MYGHRSKALRRTLHSGTAGSSNREVDLDRSSFVVMLESMSTMAPDLDRAAVLFHALSDRTRLSLLDMLRDGERCVCELQDELDAAQSRLSFHLRVLREAGLVVDRKEGRWSYYSIVPGAFAEVHDAVVEMRPISFHGRRKLPSVSNCCG